LYYKRADSPTPNQFLLFTGALAATVVSAATLLLISGGDFCPHVPYEIKHLNPCPIHRYWGNVLSWGALIIGIWYTGIFIVRIFNWRADLHEQARSIDKPRIVWAYDRKNYFGDSLLYHHFDSKSRYVGSWRLQRSWVYGVQHFTIHCPSCDSSYPVAENPEDDCMYWVKPHDNCRNFPPLFYDNAVNYLDYR
jgi:hypothetical protein